MRALLGTTYYVGEDIATKRGVRFPAVRVADKDTEIAMGLVKMTVELAGARTETITHIRSP
jgi:hypothetical protein